MAIPVQVTKRLCITPLVEIKDPVFERFYGHGLYWSLYGSQIPGPLDDSYLPNMLTSYMQCCSPDDPHEQLTVGYIAFALGMIHGGVLHRPDGALRPGVTTLVTLTDSECRRGYASGRSFSFLDATSEQERRVTDTQVIEQLCELVEEYPGSSGDPDGVIRFALGGIAGLLSGQLFPWTREEHEAWQKDSISSIGSVCTLPDTCLAASLFTPVVLAR